MDITKPPSAHRTRSYGDLPAGPSAGSAESRARIALRQLEEKQAKVEALEKELAEVRSLKQPKAGEDRPHDAISVSPDAVTVRRNGKKLVIPFALLMAVAPLVWAAITDYISLRQLTKGQTDAFVAMTARLDALDRKIADQTRDAVELRETVAQLSGYLAGVLPKAGVSVPAVESGASRITIVSDPLPPGATRVTPVVVRTPVPTPAAHP